MRFVVVLILCSVGFSTSSIIERKSYYVSDTIDGDTIDGDTTDGAEMTHATDGETRVDIRVDDGVVTGCHVCKNKTKVDEIMEFKQIKTLHDNGFKVKKLEEKCREFMATHNSLDLKALKAVIFPGTKYCGPGNISTGWNDLGVFRHTDECCRAHDVCPKGIHGFETKYNYYNYRSFKLSWCVCDESFFRCLKKAHKEDPPHSGILIRPDIGKWFFDVLKMDCFWLGECTKWKSFFFHRWCTQLKREKERDNSQVEIAKVQDALVVTFLDCQFHRVADPNDIKNKYDQEYHNIFCL